jgi:RimJ/RimL family protein N-acetyltransferase
LSAIGPVEIAAGAVQLRPWRADAQDAGALAAGFGDPDVAASVRFRAEGTQPSFEEVLTSRVEGWANGTLASFVVCDATSGDVLGSVGVHQIDRANASAEVGYWLLPKARGRGLATAAVSAVARWAFGSLGLGRLELLHATENFASCGVATRAGFGLEGTLRSSFRYGDGRLHDEHLHARLSTDPEPDATPFPHLVDGDLRLRAWRGDDIPAILASVDAQARQGIAFPEPWDEHTVTRMVGARGWNPKAETIGMALTLDGDDSWRGTVNLLHINRRHLVCEIGYWLAADARGRGLATRAVRLATGWAFDGLGMARIYLPHVVGNEASCRVATRCGYRLEGIERGSYTIDGVRVDCHAHARLATDGEPGG